MIVIYMNIIFYGTFNMYGNITWSNVCNVIMFVSEWMPRKARESVSIIFNRTNRKYIINYLFKMFSSLSQRD